jgi:hypothetical protein
MRIKNNDEISGVLARIGKRRMIVGYWWECRRERDHYKDKDVGGWTIIR